MCGICGVVHTDRASTVDVARLRRMRAALSHRGPDGQGEHRSDGVGFAHARLSVIDVATGQQPLSNEDGSVWITYNGEIYNFATLRERLLDQGHRFRTKSDTEVLVHLYEEMGTELVHELNGMFAFAIHDRRQRRVVLARDHFGIKPLYYAVRDGTLVFASEIKAVLAGLDAPVETTTAAVQEYLIFRCLAEDRSFFSGVKRLPPGSVAIWQDGQLTVRTFWTPPAPRASDLGSIEEAADALEAHLDTAVRSQLMSEVPLGAYCSGGVDSGLISTFAARAIPQRLHTFSVGFSDPEWDETASARDTATRIGSQHHVLLADSLLFQESLGRLIWNHDEPLAHPNSVLIALLSEFARQHVTVVLTGEGADEIFGGYPRHHIARANHAAQRLPSWMRLTASHALRRLGGRKGRLLGEQLHLGFTEAVVLNSAFVSPALAERLTGSAPVDVLEQRYRLAESLVVPDDPAASISRYDQRTYLPCLLDRMDRMTMSCGLEGRVPFLDVRLAEWASLVPPAYRLGVLGNKRVVKQLGARYLSRNSVMGPKSGFGVPVGDWLLTPEWASIAERLRDRNHPATSMVDTVEVNALLDAHARGDQGLSEVLWLLVNLYLWHEQDFSGARNRVLEGAAHV
jgi:asparagine synthase (glutamine-hydrolysing)